MLQEGRDAVKRLDLSSARIEQAGADRSVERADLVKGIPAVLGRSFGFDDHVADLAVSLQVLRRDVEAALREHVVETPQDAGHVPVHVDVACAGQARRQLHLREIDGADGRFLATSAPMRSCASSVEPPM